MAAKYDLKKSCIKRIETGFDYEVSAIESDKIAAVVLVGE